MLAAACDLMRARGYNGFTYHDVSAAVGVTHAAVHHYYPAKPDLAAAAVADYTARFSNRLADIAAANADPAGRLRAVAGLFAEALGAGDRVCLCGLLAAEYGTLPESVRETVRGFFTRTEAWLAGVLEVGRSEGRLRFDGAAESVAATYLTALEGALTAARVFGDGRRVTVVGDWFVLALTA